MHFLHIVFQRSTMPLIQTAGDTAQGDTAQGDTAQR